MEELIQKKANEISVNLYRSIDKDWCMVHKAQPVKQLGVTQPK